MKIISLIIICFLVQITQAQTRYSLRLIVSVPAGTDKVYIAGTFNDWNPHGEGYMLQQSEPGKQQIDLQVDPGKIKFNFTAGNMESFESDGKAGNAEEREFIIRSDTVLHLTITGWTSDYLDLSGLTDSMRLIAMIRRGFYFLERNLDSSDKYATDIYSMAQKNGSKKIEAYALDLQGNVLAKRGLTQQALAAYLKGVEIKKTLGSATPIAFVYNNIADLYYNDNDEIKAKEYYELCLNLVPSVNNKSAVNNFLLNACIGLGQIFLHMNQIDSAFFYAEKANKLGKGLSAKPLLLLGEIQQKQGNIENAGDYFRRAITVSEAGNNLVVVAEAYMQISKLLSQTDKKDSALVFARHAFSIAASIKNPFTIVNTSALMVQLFKKDNMPDSAFYYQEKVLQGKDSLFNIEKERQIQSGYYNQKIQAQMLIAQNEKYNSQLKIYLLIGSLLLLIMLGLQYRARLKTNFYKRTAAVEMKALRAQMNPHFIFNCLTSINRYIVKSDNKTASNYLTKFAKLIRMILDNSAADYITLDAEIQTLQLYMDMEALRFDDAFEYEIITDEAAASENISIPSMLIQPYAENAIWHGLMQKEEKGKLWIRFLKENDNSLKVEIEDNGIGRQKAKETESKDALKRKSYGMQISKDRIELFNQLYKFNTSVKVEDLVDENGIASGTKITIIIPAHKNLSTDNIS
ncbi:MAG TPA: histidine kinase [Panacibacter sp.]|nr:histidine kinase [Panacibacter sp.]